MKTIQDLHHEYNIPEGKPYEYEQRIRNGLNLGLFGNNWEQRGRRYYVGPDAENRIVARWRQDKFMEIPKRL